MQLPELGEHAAGSSEVAVLESVRRQQHPDAAGRRVVAIDAAGRPGWSTRTRRAWFFLRPADAGAWELLDQAACDRLLNANADA